MDAGDADMGEQPKTVNTPIGPTRASVGSSAEAVTAPVSTLFFAPLQSPPEADWSTCCDPVQGRQEPLLSSGSRPWVAGLHPPFLSTGHSGAVVRRVDIAGVGALEMEWQGRPEVATSRSQGHCNRLGHVGLADAEQYTLTVVWPAGMTSLVSVARMTAPFASPTRVPCGKTMATPAAPANVKRSVPRAEEAISR
jgi:hypothetical protein